MENKELDLLKKLVDACRYIAPKSNDLNRAYHNAKRFLLNSEPNAEVSDTTQVDSSTDDGKTNEFPNIPLRIIEGL